MAEVAVVGSGKRVRRLVRPVEQGVDDGGRQRIVPRSAHEPVRQDVIGVPGIDRRRRLAGYRNQRGDVGRAAVQSVAKTGLAGRFEEVPEAVQRHREVPRIGAAVLRKPAFGGLPGQEPVQPRRQPVCVQADARQAAGQRQRGQGGGLLVERFRFGMTDQPLGRLLDGCGDTGLRFG